MAAIPPAAIPIPGCSCMQIELQTPFGDAKTVPVKMVTVPAIIPGANTVTTTIRHNGPGTDLVCYDMLYLDPIFYLTGPDILEIMTKLVVATTFVDMVCFVYENI